MRKTVRLHENKALKMLFPPPESLRIRQDVNVIL